MNDACGSTPATRANLATLRERGVAVVEPGVGALATKHEWGAGRLAEPAELLAAVEAVVPAGRAARGTGCTCSSPRAARASRSTRALRRQPLVAGAWASRWPTRPRRCGAEVTVVAANVALPRSPRVRYVDVETAAELQAACRGRVRRVRRAAHGRRRRRLPPGRRRRRRSSRRPVATSLTPRRSSARADVLSGAGARAAAPGQTLVGFAAEHGRAARSTTAREQARAQGPRRGRASTTSPRPDIGFDAPDNEVTIVTADGERHVPRADEGRDRARDPRRGHGAARGRGGGGTRVDGPRPAGRRLADLGRRARRRRDAAAAHPDAVTPRSRCAPRCSTDLIVCVAGRGPRAGRGPAGGRQDRRSPARSPARRPAVRARPVHRRPAARRRRRHERLQPARGPLRVPARADLRERRARRRDQPRVAQDAVRACSSACRSAASPSTSTRTSSRARSSCSPRRTRSSSRAPTRCPRPRSTASWCRVSLGYPSPRREVDMLAAHETGDRVERDRAGRHRRRGARARRTRRCASTPPTRCAATSSRLLHRTREDRRVELGASPRAGLLLLRAAKARALLQGRDHALPDDVQALAEAVLAHRIVLGARGARRPPPRRRRRRAGGDAGAVGGARAVAVGRAPADRACWGCAAARRGGLFDAEPLYVPGVALRRCWPPARGLGRRAARAACRSTRTSTRAASIEERAGARSSSGPRRPARAARPASSGRPAAAAPAPLAAGRRRRARAHRRRASRAAGGASCAPPRVVVARPVRPRCAHRRAPATARRGARPAAHRAGARAAAAAAATGAAPRRGRPAGRGRGRARRPAPAPRRARPPRASTGRRWPAAASCIERRLRAEGDTRPLVVLDPRARERRGATSTRRCAPPRRWPCTWRAHGGCALLLPGDRRPPPLDADLRGWTALHVRLALLEAGGAPALGAASAPRRGPRRCSSRPAAPARAPRALAPRRRRRACSSCPARWPGGARRFARRRLHGLRARRAPRPPAAPRGGRRPPVSATACDACRDARLRRAARARAPTPTAPRRCARGTSSRCVLFGSSAGRRSCAGGRRAGAVAVRRSRRRGGARARSRRARRRPRVRAAPARPLVRRRWSLAALLAAGVPATMLRPARLGRAGAGHRRGHRRAARRHACPTAASTRGCGSSSLRAARCWPRLAALLAFWPRPRRGARAPGARRRSRSALLYAIPVDRVPARTSRSWRGALFAVPAGRCSCWPTACGPQRRRRRRGDRRAGDRRGR